MSVICQNFVQNAWKKDLCSNCFKSVGDHQGNDDGHSIDSINSNGYENGLSSMHETSCSHTPQTTWRTLTSLKGDTPTSQPFKLQTGFQGKVLTINNTTVFQKKCQPSQVFAKTSDSIDKSTKSNYCNEEKQSVVSKSRNGLRSVVNATNGTSNHVNGISNGEHEVRKNETLNYQTKSPLQGILKKRSAFEKNGEVNKPKSLRNTSTRKVSNVGFREEDPVVIGYGGRDFDPEDLDWDRASSSSDGEGGLASLDETEDDRAFSKITLVNTELNSNISVNGDTASSCDADEDEKMVNKQLTRVTTSCEEPVDVPATSVVNNDKPAPSYNADEKPSKPDCRGVSRKEEKRKVVKPPPPAPSLVVSKRNSEEGASIASEYVRTVRLQNRNSGDCSQRRRSREFTDDVANDVIDANASVIHEAINSTMLTTRHRCMEEEISSDDVFMEEPDQEVTRVSVTSVKSNDDPIETVMESNCDEESRRTCVKPRISFLHGTASDYKETTTPSAIYAPGSDFFIARSESSSSSSSEDQSQSQDSLQSGYNGRKVSSIDPKETRDDGGVEQTVLEDNTQATSSSVKLLKPKIPVKPCKAPIPARTTTLSESGHYAKPNARVSFNEEEKATSDAYYADSESAQPKRAGNHYAEVNIYHEINGKAEIDSDGQKDGYGRDNKLAALAVELERARHSQCNGKRQAPAPPRIPEPPLEEPPSCLDRTPSPDAHSPVAVYKGESMPFSSASSTASSSSQDDAVFGSWTLHGEDNSKSSKWKNSFLATQYTKCKMLAMSYNEDRFKSKKKFSLKKLLKLRKDSELASDRSSNPKAWKYSDSFERPRAKLEIIHPMDLENKSLTVNPGFDPVTRSTSTSSFTGGVEVIAIRNCASGDYGGYYSDTMVPYQEQNGESNYDYVTPERCDTSVKTSSSGSDTCSGCHHPSGSTSPTPSRCSANSQASTLTSGSSSKNGSSSSSNRPPKPPPPPRGHSSLQVISQIEEDEEKVPASESSESQDTLSLPQAPRRLYKTNPKSEYINYDGKTSSTVDIEFNEEKESASDGYYEYVQVDEKDKIHQPYDNVPHLSSTQRKDSPSVSDDKKSMAVETNCKTIQIRTQNRPALITKAPTKPPPIYSKLPNGGLMVKENAWKTLEGSYTTISANNREVLMKLVEQGMKERPCLPSSLKNRLQWEDFKMDVKTPAKFFSFGETVVYEAELAESKGFLITLIISLQHQPPPPELNSPTNLKYPCLGHFLNSIPGHLVLEDSRTDLELENIPGFVYVLCRSTVTTIDNFIQDLPEVLSEELEKELSSILLQIIQELKGLQAQGIEEIEPTFNNIILSKTKTDQHYTLVFLSTNFFEDSGNAYSLMVEDCKVSLCQYALVLISQIFKIENTEDLGTLSELKFTNPAVGRVFENVVRLLTEEKAVSLSQAKMLLECFMWGVQALIEKSDFDQKEADILLHRWIDIERSNLVKHLVNNSCEVTPYLELQAQFLTRCNTRNIKDVLTYL